MDSIFLSQKTTVDTFFKTLPDASRVFIKHKLGCVGCFLARFCTLEEVANVYELELGSFINELERYSGLPSKSKE